MELRELLPADAADFWALRLRGFREDPDAFGYSHEEASRLPPDSGVKILRKEGRSADDFVLGAFAGRVLVGIAGLEREPRRKRGHRAKVWGMYVAKGARGSGVGRALLVELISRARALPGLEALNLTVMADNAGAVRLYQSLGFQIWGHERSAMKDAGVRHDEYSMGLSLRVEGAAD